MTARLQLAERFCSWLLIGAMLSSAGPAAAATVAYWRFEEGTVDTVASGAGSILDETANNNDGTPNVDPFYRGDVPANPVPRTQTGNGLSLGLDGSSDYVNVGHSASLDLTDGFTVEFWMKGSPSQSDSLYVVIDKSHGWVDSTGWVFQGSSSSGRLSFGVGNGGGGITNFSLADSTTDLLDFEWHHVAGTFDTTASGEEIKLYVDGVLEDTAVSGPMVTNTRDINIGMSWHGGPPLIRFFNGHVDEVRISNTVLEPTEFLNAPTSVPALGPLGLGLLVVLIACGPVAFRCRS
jgi:hypothetical protein